MTGVQTCALPDLGKIIEGVGTATETVPAVLELFASNDSSDSDTRKRGYVSDGKQYLGKTYKNSKSYRESRQSDYRKNAKKQVKRLSGTSSARNVR